MRLEARPGDPRQSLGAHAADLRVQLLRCSLTHARCARSAARSFTRISATWIADSLAEGIRPRLLEDDLLVLGRREGQHLRAPRLAVIAQRLFDQGVDVGVGVQRVVVEKGELLHVGLLGER